MASRFATAVKRIFGGGKAAGPWLAFDAGRSQRRLRSVPTSQAAVNAQIRTYGKNILARSRYLAANNPYAAAAKETFISALAGNGIKPSPLTKDSDLKKALIELWRESTDEFDADNLTDIYGLQAMVAGEMFEAGEMFVRFRDRRSEDGLIVPLQLQLLPAEMLPIELNTELGNGRRIECGIEFDAIGRRTAYHFLRRHPGDDQISFNAREFSVVPAEQVLHLFKPMRAGQIRGLPHTLSAIVKSAIMDQYDDAELERKRTAALFAAFVERPAPEDDGAGPLGTATEIAKAESGANATSSFGLEPGATIELRPGEKVSFAEPADLGGSYEAFQYRTLLAIAAGFGVPYVAMTGDLRQTSYGSIRAGLVEFRRRIEALQNSVMIYQFCRPVWQRWLDAAVLAGEAGISPSEYVKKKRELYKVKWMTPKWDWIDPLKDLQAEKLAVDEGYKARSDVIESIGEDAEETDARIAADQAREEALGLELHRDGGNASPAAAPQSDDGSDGLSEEDELAAPGGNGRANLQ